MPRHHHITPVLKSLQWLKISERIHFTVLSLTYNSLQFSQPTYLRELFTIQPTRSTRSSSCLTLSTPGHFSSHVLQPSHFHHWTTSLEWPATWIPHHFLTSTIVIANHKTSSSSGSYIHQPRVFHCVCIYSFYCINKPVDKPQLSYIVNKIHKIY